MTVENRVQAYFLLIVTSSMLAWVFLTLWFHNAVLSAYDHSNLGFSLLTVYTVLFAVTFTMATIVQTSIWGANPNDAKTKFLKIQRGGLQGLTAGLSILLIANIVAFITSGLPRVIAIYWQILNFPFEFFLLFNLWRQIAKAERVTKTE